MNRKDWTKERSLNGLSTDDEAYWCDYVKAFIKRVKRIHNSDREFQQLRQESLGQTITVEDHIPPLLNVSFEDSSDLSPRIFCVAMVPVLREKYQGSFPK